MTGGFKVDQCTLCSSVLSSRSSLRWHRQTVHRVDMAGNPISSEELEKARTHQKHKCLMAAAVTGPSARSSLLFSF